jgi:DNA modification methylase
MNKPKILQWYNCYDDSNKKWITSESMTHPAKMSVGLCKRIYKFLEEIQAIKKGDLIIDPFGGIAMTGLIGSHSGYKVITVELEPKFVKLGNENIDKHIINLSRMVLPFPEHIQGDSRNLVEIIKRKCSSIISSPPYADTAIQKSAKGVNLEKQYKSYQASGGGQTFEQFKTTQLKHSLGYGYSEGQIGALKSGNADGIISSPPYEGISTGQGGLNTKPSKNGKGQTGRNPKLASQNTDQKYGISPGQISRLKGGAINSIIEKKEEKKETYWEAMYKVYSQCYEILKDDGSIAIVVKDFVRKGKIIPLGDDTVKLLEHIGFKTEYRIHAMVIQDLGSTDMFTGNHGRKSRKSFFRRLQEQKGSPEINWEEVIIARKQSR